MRGLVHGVKVLATGCKENLRLFAPNLDKAVLLLGDSVSLFNSQSTPAAFLQLHISFSVRLHIHTNLIS